jgi:hypothetical protein
MVGTEEDCNTFCRRFPQFFEETAGDILLVGSDEKGEACDVNVDQVKALLRRTNNILLHQEQ